MKNILIVDDDYGVLKMFEYNLLDCGDYDIFLAEDLNTAKKIVSKENIDLMVLDIRMGVHDGMSFWQALEESGRHIKTVVVTGCDPDHESSVLAKKKGLKVFYKPVKIKSIIEYICNAV